MFHTKTSQTHDYTYTNYITVMKTLGLERSCGTSKKFRVPTWYVPENKGVPDRNIGVPPVRKYANYRTLRGEFCGQTLLMNGICWCCKQRVRYRVTGAWIFFLYNYIYKQRKISGLPWQLRYWLLCKWRHQLQLSLSGVFRILMDPTASFKTEYILGLYLQFNQKGRTVYWAFNC